jgi:hypothetical protein
VGSFHLGFLVCPEVFRFKWQSALGLSLVVDILRHKRTIHFQIHEFSLTLRYASDYLFPRP